MVHTGLEAQIEAKLSRVETWASHFLQKNYNGPAHANAQTFSQALDQRMLPPDTQ